MIPALAKRAHRKYRRDGLSSLLQTAARRSVRGPLSSVCLVVEDDEIFSYASDVVRVEDGTDSEITYDGMWRPPHPAHIPAVEGRATAAPRVVCEFQDARLVGTSPVVEIDGRYIPPSTIGATGINNNKERQAFRENVRIADVLSRARTNSRPPDVDSAFLLTGHYDVFGHWSFEILPKLRAYEEYTEKTGTEPVILTKANLTSWQRESLELLGYPADSLLEKGEEPLSVGTLLVPSHRYLTWTHVPSYPSSRDLQWVSDRIEHNLDDSGDAFGDRIYVSREDAPRRHVRNRREVLDVLEAYEFEVYEPGRLSFADQVRLFSGAEIVVGPYGAGVSNVIFAEDADFVELVIDAEENIHHFVLANLVDIDYEYVVCRPQVEDGVALRNSDMVVDTDRLRETLEERF